MTDKRARCPKHRFLTLDVCFNKFLITRNEQPVVRSEPEVKPDSPQVISAIESALKS